MRALLVFPLWISCFIVLATSKRFQDWRDPFLVACTIWGVAVTALTEGLSLFRLLSFWPVAAAWLLLSLASALASAVVLRRSSGGTGDLSGHGFLPKSLGFSGWVLLGGIIIILSLTVCVALLSPPNNYDSMTYHLMRVVNWMDHRSVRYYPTHNLLQLYLFPWAEYAMLHLQLLSGGDRFAACVQCFSMLGCVIAVSRIAGKLGATRYAQLFASVCCATIPLAILEASSTQNDLVTAFWLVCFLNSALDLVNGEITWQSATLAGANLGLVALTKTTGLLFTAPFLVWIGFSMFRRCGARGMAVPIWILFCTALLTAPHLYRNWSTFGAFLEPPNEGLEKRNQTYSPAAIASILVRDIAMHASGLPRGWGVVVRAVERFHRFIGQDLYDPRTTWSASYGHPRRAPPPHFLLGQALDEDTAGNPLHLVLEGMAVVLCLWSPRHRIYALCVCAGFLLYGALVKWDPWVARYELPLFVATAPITAIAFGFPGLRRSMPLVGIVLVLLGLIPVTMNRTRPLLSHSSILFRNRTSLYFEKLSSLQGPYLAAAAELSKTPSSRVGVFSGLDTPEYPLRLLAREAAPSLQFEYVEVHNSSKRAVSSEQPAWPDTIVTIQRPDLDDLLARRGMHPVLISGGVSIYRSAQGGAASTGQ